LTVGAGAVDPQGNPVDTWHRPGADGTCPAHTHMTEWTAGDPLKMELTSALPAVLSRNSKHQKNIAPAPGVLGFEAGNPARKTYPRTRIL
jgi:hypothetical protein